MEELNPILLTLAVLITLLDTRQAVTNDSQSEGRSPELDKTLKESFSSNENSVGTGLRLTNVEQHLGNFANEPEQEPSLNLNDSNKELTKFVDLEWLLDRNGQRRVPKNDFHNLIDLRCKFDFVINHEACPKSVEVLFLVHSAPGHVEKRRTIRETWGSVLDTRRVLLYFILGTINKKEDQLKIEEENEAMGDIIQGNFHDSYRNLTYKHVSVLKWFSYYCPLAKFLIKTDDDVFVNSLYLMDYLLGNRNHIQEEKHLLWCKKLPLEKVHRDKVKWQVSVEEYSNKYYPPFCQGGSIIYSADLVKDLYVEAQKTKYFWIDDAHVTGTLTQQLNVNIKPLEKMFKTVKEAKELGKLNGYQEQEYFFVSFYLTQDQVKGLWNCVSKAITTSLCNSVSNSKSNLKSFVLEKVLLVGMLSAFRLWKSNL